MVLLLAQQQQPRFCFFVLVATAAAVLFVVAPAANGGGLPLLRDDINNPIVPRSWYRFEDGTDLGKDTMGNHHLSRALFSELFFMFCIFGLSSKSFG